MIFYKNKKVNEKTPTVRRKSTFFDKEMSKLVQEGKSQSLDSAQDKKEYISGVLADMGNIEFCIEYYTKLARDNQY